MEKEKYAIINHGHLTKLFTNSCVSKENTRAPYDIGSVRCGLIKSRHVGNGRDRLLIVKHKHSQCQNTAQGHAKVITPITQITEQARSYIESENSEKTSQKGAIVISSEGTATGVNAGDRLGVATVDKEGKNVEINPSYLVSKKRKASKPTTTTTTPKVKGKRSRLHNKKRIRDLLT